MDAKAKRTDALISNYEKMFAERSDMPGCLTPTDPLEFHLFHLARYWSRLIGFCRQYPSKPNAWVDTDLGACVQIGSDYAHKLIGPDSPIYTLWQDYWKQTQKVLHERPVTIEAVEAASKAFNACITALKYDPWARAML